MTPYTASVSSKHAQAGWLALSAFLWVLSLLTLSGAYLALNVSIEGPPASAEVWMPVGIVALVAWLLCLIRRL